MLTDAFINEVSNELTKERAIEIAMSEWWISATPLEQVYVQLNLQPKLIMDFPTFHTSLEKVLDMPIYTHQLGMLEYVNHMKKIVEQKWNARNMIPCENTSTGS